MKKRLKEIIVKAISGFIIFLAIIGLMALITPPRLVQKVYAQTPVLQMLGMTVWKGSNASWDVLAECDRILDAEVISQTILIPMPSTATQKIYICDVYLSLNGQVTTNTTFDLYEGMAGILTPTTANCLLTPTALLGNNTTFSTPTNSFGIPNFIAPTPTASLLASGSNSFATGTIPLVMTTNTAPNITYQEVSAFPHWNTQVAGNSLCLGLGTNGTPVHVKISYSIR